MRRRQPLPGARKVLGQRWQAALFSLAPHDAGRPAPLGVLRHIPQVPAAEVGCCCGQLLQLWAGCKGGKE